MVRFTAMMLGVLVCSLAISYQARATYVDEDMSSTGANYSAHVIATEGSSTDSATDNGGYDGSNHIEHHDDNEVVDGSNSIDEYVHHQSHQSQPIQWEEGSGDQHSASNDCDDASSGASDDQSNNDDSNDSQIVKKLDWRDLINDKYEGAIEEMYDDAKAVLRKWGLLSVKSQSSENYNSRSTHSSHNDDRSGYGYGDSNAHGECVLNDWKYNSRSCKSYGMFDDGKYNETQTAYTRSKGLMVISEPLYMSKTDVNGRTLGQLGVHFAMCEDYNKKSGAQFRLGLYEKQRSTSRSRKWGSKSGTWSLVAKTDLQKFNRRGNEYAMYAVDANSTIALKPNTYYTIITTIAPGSSLTMFTDDADSRVFSSFDFAGTTNNLPKTWDGKKVRNWSPVSMELTMCRTKK